MSEEIDIRNSSVMIAMPVYHRIPPLTVISLLKTVQYTVQVGIACNTLMEISSAITVARDGLLDEFVNSEFEKLLWIDSDVTWEVEDFQRLLALSTKYPVVGAAYPARRPDSMEVYVETIEGNKPDEQGLVAVKGMGLGFTIVDREVIEKVIRGKPRVMGLHKREMREVFRFDSIDGKRRGEDMAFFADIRALGYDVMLDATMRLGHIGDYEWKLPMTEKQRSAA